MLPFFVFAAVVIIAVLSIVAWKMRAKVKDIERKQREQEVYLEQKKQEQHKKWNKSIYVLAQGVLDDQVTLTEAAMRIGVLLEYLDASEDIKDEFSAFFQLAEATAHIPILEEWKKLSAKQKMRFDKERLSIEDQYKDFVIDAAKRIKNRTF